MNKTTFTLAVEPIDTAPIKPGVVLELVLLTPGVDEPWTVGRWNGDGWFDKDGYQLRPRYWAPLPDPAALLPA